MNVSEFKAWFEGFIENRASMDGGNIALLKKKVDSLHENWPEFPKMPIFPDYPDRELTSPPWRPWDVWFHNTTDNTGDVWFHNTTDNTGDIKQSRKPGWWIDSIDGPSPPK